MSALMKCCRKDVKPLNMCQYPIYSVEVYKDKFVYIGGGGSMGVANVIQGYKFESGSQLLGEPIHTEKTGDELALFMQVPRSGCNMLATCIGPQLVVYKIHD